MADFKGLLYKLNKHLNILNERKAKYAGNAPLELLNQIEDHEQAITLTRQVITGELTEAEWREALEPLLITVSGQTSEAVEPRIPLQRPPRAEHFTNRDAELAQLLADLQPGQVVTLCGPGGIFQAKTKRTAHKRYEALMAVRNDYVTAQPQLASLFDSLERHWPKLVNGIESTIIPRTNNAVELVIRRFDQHYQNFCGFDSLDSARRFLAVFEKVYRFTPFTEDAQPRVRGKCPLELAGYDITQLSIARICRGWALGWPLDFDQETVPNV